MLDTQSLPPLHKHTPRTQFSGISPVIYAFFNADGTLDLGAMERQIECCIAEGAHGITILGIVTEVTRLDVNERRALMEHSAKVINGRVPLTVTIAEPSIEGQRAFAEAAAGVSAAWVVLQPPSVKGLDGASLATFFGEVAVGSKLPVAIQNNPMNLPVWLSNDALVDLCRRHDEIQLMKGEGTAVRVNELIKAGDGLFDVFCGHGGIEYMMNLTGGAAGLIPAPELVKEQVKLHEAFVAGDLEEAERIHRDILPLIVFMSRAVPDMLLYGKRVMAKRMGLKTVHDRRPIRPVDPMVLDYLEWTARDLPEFSA